MEEYIVVCTESPRSDRIFNSLIIPPDTPRWAQAVRRIAKIIAMVVGDIEGDKSGRGGAPLTVQTIRRREMVMRVRERATSGVGGWVLLEPVGALNRDQPRAQHTVQDNHSLSYIENRVQPRERGGCGGGCGVVEVDIWRRARYGSGTNNTGRSRRGRESTGWIKKETSGRDNEKETRQK